MYFRSDSDWQWFSSVIFLNTRGTAYGYAFGAGYVEKTSGDSVCTCTCTGKCTCKSILN